MYKPLICVQRLCRNEIIPDYRSVGLACRLHCIKALIMAMFLSQSHEFHLNKVSAVLELLCE